MTILYIGNQDDDGKAVAAALRDTAPGVGVVWESHFDRATHWLREHPDVAALVVDAYVEGDVRHEAFTVARLLRGERYTKLLTDLADQAELEGTPLLAAAEAELRQQRGLGK